MNRTLHFEVLTRSFAVDVDSPAVASVDNHACVFGDVFPPECLQRQRRVRIRNWCSYVHRGLANAVSRRIILGPSGWSCKTNYYYYYYNYHLTLKYYIMSRHVIYIVLYYVILYYIVLYCVILYIILYYFICPIILSGEVPMMLNDRRIWW